MTNIRKPKKCKVCEGEFYPISTTHKACSLKCAMALVKPQVDAKVKKVERKKAAEEKERVKSRSKHLQEAQHAFNAFIRERDKDLPCISCGRHHAGQYHAGHYMSVGSTPELRFDENNCNKQCSVCNNHLSGNHIKYRKNLIEKIGLAEVERLESFNSPLHMDIDQIKGIKYVYQRKLKILRMAHSANQTA